MPGAAAAEKVLLRLARSSREVLDQRTAIAAEVEEVLDAHPLARVLTPMPGVGVRTAARISLEVGDASAFPTAGRLAAYAGLAPVTRRPESSTREEHPPRGGNKHLDRAFPLSAFAALGDPTSRAHYDRGRAAARSTTALICLARRRVDVLHAMLRNAALDEVRPARAARPTTWGHPPGPAADRRPGTTRAKGSAPARRPPTTLQARCGSEPT